MPVTARTTPAAPAGTGADLREHVTDTTLLVCATPGPAQPAQVVLADGSYQTQHERVFWRRSPDAEVLRVALQTPVVIRPLRHVPTPRSSAAGEQRLLAALAPYRPPTAEEGAPQVRPNERLAGALAQGDVAAAEAVAARLWRREGLAATHAELAASLAAAPARRARSGGSVLHERTASATAVAVLERLRALSAEMPSRPRQGDRPVVLAVPPGDPHTMVLSALAHQLEDAGETVLVIEDVPVQELAALAAAQRPLAVVVSAHLPWSAAGARTFLGAVRAASPDTLLAVGGPGAPPSLRRADLVTSDPTALLQALRTRTGGLTPREREVLLAVAEGRTTNEIADTLGLSPATVKTHLDRIFSKTDTVHRAAAVARALRQGWIS
jgi:DNA-binding CsgD family transcriptional regulator